MSYKLEVFLDDEISQIDAGYIGSEIIKSNKVKYIKIVKDEEKPTISEGFVKTIETKELCER